MTQPCDRQPVQRRAMLIGALCAVVIVLAAPRLMAQSLVVDLSNPVVAITADFTGTDLLLFGSASTQGDIAIIVRGPQEHHVVREKSRVAGVWLNTDKVTFTELPSYYAVLSNRQIKNFVPEAMANVHQIGFKNLLFKPQITHDQVENPAPFADAVLRIKEKQGLYKSDPTSVSFLGHGLFRATLHFPANVSVGTYGIDVYLFNKGELIDTQTTLINIRKFGVEAGVFDFAHRYSLAYGILAILAALVMGWASYAVFGRR